MTKYLKKCFIFIFLIAVLFASVFCVQITNKTTNISYAETLNNNISIFIRKPTYSVYYNEKVFFIDDSINDKMLKCFDVQTNSFSQNYINIADYSIIASSFIGKNWFFVVSSGSQNKLIKVDLSTMQLFQFDTTFESYYNSIFAQEINFGTDNYTIISLSAKNYNTKLLVIDNQDEIVDNMNIMFKQEDDLLTTIKNSLAKTIVYQDQNEKVYFMFIYNSTIAYFSVDNYEDLENIKTNEITSVTHIAANLDSSNNEISITNVYFSVIDNQDYIVISYLKRHESEETEILKLYSFTLGSGTTSFTYLTHYQCNNAKFLNFNKNYYSYIDTNEQEIVYTKIYKEEDSFRESSSKIRNPKYNITYLSDDNFVYKKTNKITELFEDPWGAESKVVIKKDANVIKIGEAKLENNKKIEDYDYCLFTYNDKNYSGFVQSKDLVEKDSITVSDFGYKTRVTVWPNTTLYSLPTYVTKGTIGDDNSNLISKKLIQIEDNSVVEVLDVLCDYSVENSNNQIGIIKVRVNGEEIGYIKSLCVRNPSTIVNFIITNAIIKSDNTTVYLEADINSTPLIFKLNSGKNVRINGSRNTKTGLTSITFNDEYGNEFTGYVETDFVKADAWSALQIVGCILVAINLGLLILILVFRKRRLGNRGQKINN